MGMGRPRKHNRHLPPRMRLSHGAYYRVTPAGWENLGREYGPALKKWAELEALPVAARTVGDAITLYAADRLPALAAKTQRDYTRICGELRKTFGDALLNQVRPVHIAQYLEKRSKKTAANREMAVLSSVFNYAMRLGYAESNPCRGVRRNSEHARTRLPTSAEIAALKLRAPPYLRAAISLSLATALRASSLLRLDIPASSAERIEVPGTKGGRALRIKITPELRTLIDEARAGRDVGPLFVGRRKRRLTYDGLSTAWDLLRERVAADGMESVRDLHWHDLRAWALTEAERTGGRAAARALAGHRSESTTAIYLRDRSADDVDPVAI